MTKEPSPQSAVAVALIIAFLTMTVAAICAWGIVPTILPPLCAAAGIATGFLLAMTRRNER